jgi:hypothetical protein
MGCKTETKEIGNNTYTVIQWPAEKSMLIKFKLINVFGESFGKIIANAKAVTKEEGSAEDKTKGFEQLCAVISDVFAKHSPENVLKLMKEVVFAATVVNETYPNGIKFTKSVFEELYQDNLLEFYKVFAFVLQVNYSHFLPQSQPVPTT